MKKHKQNKETSLLYSLGNGPKEEIRGNRRGGKCYNFPNGDESRDMIG